MSLVSVYGNIEIRGGTVTLESSNQFPAEPYLGMFAFVSGVLYVYNRLNGLLSWYPMTKKDQYYVHLQEPSAVWDITHNLGSTELIYMVYDSEDMLQQAAIEIIDASSARFTFENAFEGKAVLFVAEDNLEGIDTLRATIGEMYFEGKKIVIDGEDLISKINSLIVWSENVYTQTEVDALIDTSALSVTGDTDQKIQTVYDTMTANLSSAATATTQEINSKVSALKVTVAADLSGKVDKVAGMGLSTNDFSATYRTKLDGVASYANYYVHPDTHPATIIVQDPWNRFVTDVEKAAWAAKASTNTATDSTNGLMSVQDYIKLRDIEAEANNYIHPETHSAAMIVADATHRFVTDSQISIWNGKQDNLSYTPENAAHRGVANGYASLDSLGVVPISQLPGSIKEIQVVADITARDSLVGVYEGMRVYVLDATADPTVVNGWAEYMWTGTAWAKTATWTSEGTLIVWDNIDNRPTSAVSAIDQAVTDSHTHANKSVLDATSASFTTDDRSKLDGIALSANNYVHPASHPATMIVEDATHRFVTDTQISTWNSYAYTHPSTHPATMITTDTTHRFATDTQIADWNAKASVAVATTSANGLMASTDKSKLDGIAASANNYVHPTSHAISFITGLQTALDGKLATTANAVSATKLATARTISLAGDVTGSATFDGSANISITATVADDSHNHTIANVDGLQTALDGKLSLTSANSGTVHLGNVSTRAGVDRTIELATNTAFGGVHDQHTGIRLVATNMNGWDTAELHVQVGVDWGVYASTSVSLGKNIWTSGSLNASGDLNCNAVNCNAVNCNAVNCNGVNSAGNIVIRNGGPTLYFKDTDHRSASIHVNSSIMYFMRASTVDYTDFYPPYPLTINLDSCEANFAASVTATSFNVSSKRELKDNITPFVDNALDIINALNIVNFTYKSDDEKKPHVGIIADDTDPIISGPNQDTFDIANTSGILVKAVQELNDKNNILALENIELKKKVQEMELRLSKIEGMINFKLNSY